MLLRSTAKIPLMLVGLSALCFGQSFTRSEYPVGGQPNSVVSADFNSDGVADQVVTDSMGNTVAILLGHGDGTFGSASSVAVATQPTEIIAADLNGDGRADLAVACGGSAVTVLLGNGDGTFRRADVAVGGKAVSLTSGDVNGDGKIDLLVAAGSKVEVLLGNGDGMFTAGSSFATDVTPMQVRLADLNNDGKLDLAIGACCQGSDVTYGAFYAYAGNGDGTFTNKFSSDQADGTKLTVADVTGDGLPDLILPYIGCHTPCNGVEVAVNGGNFSFTRFGGGGGDSGLFYGGRGPAAVADFNGDGKPEVASAAAPGDGTYGKGYDKVLIWQVGTDGKFTSQGDYVVGTDTGPWGIATGDFNHDGKVDFAVVEQHTGKVAVFLNNTGSADAQQTFEFSMQFSPQTVKAGDSAKYGYSIEATNGTLPSPLQLSCSGLPTGTACNFDTPPTASFTTGFLTISTTPPASAATYRSFEWLAIALPFGFVFVPVRGRKLMWLGLMLAAVALVLLAGCAGGGNNLTPANGGGSTAGGTTGGTSGGTDGGSTGTPSPTPTPTPAPPPAAGPTPAGTYQVTVNATGAGITPSQVVTLVVQ